METLKYIIQNRTEIAQRMKAECPSIEHITFEDVKGCPYVELKEVADGRKATVDIKDGIANIIVVSSDFRFFVYSKPLIVSEPVIMEE